MLSRRTEPYWLAQRDLATIPARLAESLEVWRHLPPSPRDFVRYSVLHGNEKLFATRYKLVLPTEEQLRVELIREQRLLEERAEPKGRRRK